MRRSVYRRPTKDILADRRYLKAGNRDLIIRENVSGQVWGHTPEQRVATSILRRYSLGFRLAIAHADDRPAMPVSFELDSTLFSYLFLFHYLIPLPLYSINPFQRAVLLLAINLSRDSNLHFGCAIVCYL